MIFKKISASCSVFLLIATFSCSSDNITPEEPVEELLNVTITTPVDADGILNKVEANAVIVNGTSTLEDGSIITVVISDDKNVVSGTAVVKEGKWVTESMAISGFENGKITVTAEGVNEYGTFSNIAEASLFLDQVSPNITITGPIAGNDIIDTGEATSVVVKGTSDAANDQTVLITFGDSSANHLTTETKVREGHWEATLDVSALNSGSVMLMAEVSDLAGNPATVQRSGVTLE